MTHVSVVPVIKLHHCWSHSAVVVLLGQFGLHLLHMTRAGLSGGGGDQCIFTPSVTATTTTKSIFRGRSVPTTFKMNAHSCTWRCVSAVCVCVFLLRFCSCLHHLLGSCGLEFILGFTLAWCVCGICVLWFVLAEALKCQVELE